MSYGKKFALSMRSPPPFNDSAKITSPDLALGDAIRVIYILEQTTGQARWRWTWEPVGFEHSDLYGFGDDSYEF